MTERRQTLEPGETIYPPRPSWAPAFFAIGALGLIGGIYASGFIFASYIYAIVGAIFALAAFRSLVRGSIREFYRLPRHQQVRGAALPVETISTPPKP